MICRLVDEQSDGQRDDELKFVQPFRRRPDTDEGKTHGNRSKKHPASAAAKSRSGSIRKVADERIAGSVPKSCRCENRPHDRGRDEQHIGGEFHVINAKRAHDPKAILGVTHAPMMAAGSRSAGEGGVDEAA